MEMEFRGCVEGELAGENRELHLRWAELAVSVSCPCRNNGIKWGVTSKKKCGIEAQDRGPA